MCDEKARVDKMQREGNETIAEKMLKLALERRDEPNLTIMLDDGTSETIHSFVARTRSTLMSQYDCQQTKSYTLHEYTRTQLQVVVTFMYTSAVELRNEDPRTILKLADHLGIQDLEQELLPLLLNQQQEDILTLAIELGNPGAINFLIENHPQEYKKMITDLNIVTSKNIDKGMVDRITSIKSDVVKADEIATFLLTWIGSSGASNAAAAQKREFIERLSIDQLSRDVLQSLLRSKFVKSEMEEYFDFILDRFQSTPAQAGNMQVSEQEEIVSTPNSYLWLYSATEGRKGFDILSRRWLNDGESVGCDFNFKVVDSIQLGDWVLFINEDESILFNVKSRLVVRKPLPFTIAEPILATLNKDLYLFCQKVPVKKQDYLAEVDFSKQPSIGLVVSSMMACINLTNFALKWNGSSFEIFHEMPCGPTNVAVELTKGIFLITRDSETHHFDGGDTFHRKLDMPVKLNEPHLFGGFGNTLLVFQVERPLAAVYNELYNTWSSVELNTTITPVFQRRQRLVDCNGYFYTVKTAQTNGLCAVWRFELGTGVWEAIEQSEVTMPKNASAMFVTFFR